MDETDRDLMTVTEAAAALGMSVRGVADRLQRGTMRGVKVNPRLWLVPRDEVERWRERGKLKTGRPREDRQLGKQYDERVVTERGETLRVRFWHKRDVPVPANVAPFMAITSQMRHTFRAVVCDEHDNEFMVEQVAYGPGEHFPPDPRQRDGALRREVVRRLRTGEWEDGGVYSAEE